MKYFMIAVFILVCIIVSGIILTYMQFHREMEIARNRLLTGSEILKTDQGVIEYSVKGDGIPVLLLHGAGGGYDQGFWGGKITFGEGYKFISVSRFGYLRTPIPQGASIKSQASLYALLLDHLGIDQAIIFGASAGGPSAIQFANDYPGRTSALILFSAVSMAEAPGDKDPFYIKIIHSIQKSDYVYWIFTKFMQSLILNLMGVPSDIYAGFTPEQKELAQEMLDIMHPMSQRHKGTINDGEMIKIQGVSTSQITSPTLIIHTKDDALVSYEHAENIHNKITGSKLVLFDTGGHAMLTQMDKVREHVKKFLKEISE